MSLKSAIAHPFLKASYNSKGRESSADDFRSGRGVVSSRASTTGWRRRTGHGGSDRAFSTVSSRRDSRDARVLQRKVNSSPGPPTTSPSSFASPHHRPSGRKSPHHFDPYDSTICPASLFQSND
ncbi:hypothetical protein TNCV_2138251 [Trichonephila clavipes]|nr:hypothetical protein TNCV_2138251 [Trichonephila clavipes]